MVFHPRPSRKGKMADAIKSLPKAVLFLLQEEMTYYFEVAKMEEKECLLHVPDPAGFPIKRGDLVLVEVYKGRKFFSFLGRVKGKVLPKKGKVAGFRVEVIERLSEMQLNGKEQKK